MTPVCIKRKRNLSSLYQKRKAMERWAVERFFSRSKETFGSETTGSSGLKP